MEFIFIYFRLTQPLIFTPPHSKWIEWMQWSVRCNKLSVIFALFQWIGDFWFGIMIQSTVRLKPNYHKYLDWWHGQWPFFKIAQNEFSVQKIHLSSVCRLAESTESKFPCCPPSEINIIYMMNFICIQCKSKFAHEFMQSIRRRFKGKCWPTRLEHIKWIELKTWRYSRIHWSIWICSLREVAIMSVFQFQIP